MAKYVIKDPKKAALLAAWAEAWNIGQDDIQKQISDSMNNDECVSIYFYAINNDEYSNVCPVLTMPKRCFSVEYDPDSWNNYPEVTPPEGVWMRVEASALDDFGEKLIVKFFGAFYVEGAWRSSVDIKDWETFRIFRFRPWEG